MDEIGITEAQTPLKGWHPFTLKDAYGKRSSIEYIVESLIEAPSITIVYGAPGSLKSFLLADLACCIVGGIDWLLPPPNNTGISFPVHRVPVVWLDFDNGNRRTHDRFGALGRANQLPADAPLFYYSIPNPWLDMSKESHAIGLARILREHLAKLLIIDNLGTISGGADENSADMIEIFAHLRWVAERTGAAIILIHHRRKANGSNGRKGDELRGHSSIEASIELALLVDREASSKTVNILPTKVRGSEVSPFSAVFTHEHDAQGQLREARFFCGPKVGFMTMKTIMVAVYRCASEEPRTKQRLTKETHKELNGEIGVNRIGDAIDLMVEEGYLSRTIGRNNAQIITRNPEKQI